MSGTLHTVRAISKHVAAGRSDLRQVRFPEGGGNYTYTGKDYSRALDFSLTPSAFIIFTSRIASSKAACTSQRGSLGTLRS
jgi:hypothetical protein